MTPLSQRKQQILRALVEEYIHTAIPVASETLVRKYRLNYSSATVRHELAGLEEAMLIYQPHTSAGRVPTDLGYRYFVEHLMQESALSLDEQRLIRHQFYQVQDQLDQNASAVAAKTHETLLKLSENFESTAREHVQSLLVSMGTNVTKALEERTAEISREFSAGLEGYTRNYLEFISKAIAEIPKNPPAQSHK